MNKITHALSFIKRTETLAFFIASVAAFFLFPVVFNFPIYPSAGGTITTDSLDPSYRMALSKANFDHLNWGKDFVFTYGPLSYLPLKLGWGINKYQFLFFDIFMYFNFFCIFYTGYLKSNYKLVALILIVATASTIPLNPSSGCSLVLLAFLIYWIRQGLERNNPFFDFMQLAIILLIFFIKFNSGLIGIVFFVIGLLYRVLVSKENKLWIASHFLLSVSLIFILAKLLNVSIWEYIVSGFNLVSGYNEIMYLEHSYSKRFIFSVILSVLVVSILTLVLFSEKSKLAKKVVIFFLFSATTFVLYKQSFVRADEQHTLDFFTYILLVVLCTPDFYDKKKINLPLLL